VAEDQLSFIIADLTRFTADQTQALALDIQANLQEDTPRDTGWARANWVMSLRAPVIDPQVSAVKDPTPAQVAQAFARQKSSMSEVLDYTLAEGAIFTTNNVPYIGKLNEGWSKQAGSAFIQRAVADAVNFANVARGADFRVPRSVQDRIDEQDATGRGR
jgi:hypothetical protein